MPILVVGSIAIDNLKTQLEERREEPEAVAELGVAYATLQCVELLENGAPGIHFYTLNKSPATRAVVSALYASRLGLLRVPATTA